MQRLCKRLPVGGWVPLYDQQFCANIVLLTLINQRINKNLHAVQKISAVAVVATPHDETEIWGG